MARSNVDTEIQMCAVFDQRIQLTTITLRGIRRENNIVWQAQNVKAASMRTEYLSSFTGIPAL